MALGYTRTCITNPPTSDATPGPTQKNTTYSSDCMNAAHWCGASLRLYSTLDEYDSANVMPCIVSSRNTYSNVSVVSSVYLHQATP